jgi:hypothetical protein
LLITKGNPTSSRGCYQLVPVIIVKHVDNIMQQPMVRLEQVRLDLLVSRHCRCGSLFFAGWQPTQVDAKRAVGRWACCSAGYAVWGALGDLWVILDLPSKQLQ